MLRYLRLCRNFLFPSKGTILQCGNNTPFNNINLEEWKVSNMINICIILTQNIIKGGRVCLHTAFYSFGKKKKSQSILCWNASRNTSEKLSKKTQERCSSRSGKNIIILYFSHYFSMKKGWSRKLSSEICLVVKRSVFPSNSNRNIHLKFLLKKKISSTWHFPSFCKCKL